MPHTSKLNRPAIFGIGLALFLLVAAANLAWTHAQQPRAAADLSISIEQFARYIDQWSEQEGYFDSDNFISNETSYLQIIDQLENQVKPDCVCLGVGPDQNFSYLAHMRPKLAVITDIRRQNMLEHLWYKALFAMSSDRVEYVSLLVSR